MFRTNGQVASGVPDNRENADVDSASEAAETCGMEANFTWAQKAVAALLERCAKAIGAEAALMVRRQS